MLESRFLERVDVAPHLVPERPEHAPLSVMDVRVTAVTEHDWRVSDNRLPLHDPARLLGYVERRGHVFEVLQLGTGFEWHEFDTMDAALRFAIATGPRLASARSRSRAGHRC